MSQVLCNEKLLAHAWKKSIVNKLHWTMIEKHIECIDCCQKLACSIEDQVKWIKLVRAVAFSVFQPCQCKITYHTEQYAWVCIVNEQDKNVKARKIYFDVLYHAFVDIVFKTCQYPSLTGMWPKQMYILVLSVHANRVHAVCNSPRNLKKSRNTISSEGIGLKDWQQSCKSKISFYYCNTTRLDSSICWSWFKVIRCMNP